MDLVDQLEVNRRILAEEKAEREWANRDPLRDEIAELRREIAELKKRKPLDSKTFADGIVGAVKGYVDPALSNIRKQIDKVENLRGRVRELEWKNWDVEKLKAHFEAHFGDRISEVERAIDDQRQRLRMIEKRGSGLTYRGVWQRAENYFKGDCVTYDASLWIALDTTSETPNQSKQWQLAAKGR